MLGKNHLLFNFMSMLSLYVYLYKMGYNPLTLIISLLLFVLFSNAPDFDILYNKGSLVKRLIRTFFLVPFYVTAKVTHDSIAHRHITHSIKGITIFSVFILSLWGILHILLDNFTHIMNITDKPFNIVYLVEIFSDPFIPVSITVAYILHILGDIITVSGVQLFGGRRVRGFIVTGKNDSYYVFLYAVLQSIFMVYFLELSELRLLIVFSAIILIIFIIIPIVFASKSYHEYKYHI